MLKANEMDAAVLERLKRICQQKTGIKLLSSWENVIDYLQTGLKLM